jgi:hypothetical protein
VGNPGRYPTDVRSWGTPFRLLGSGLVVAGGPGHRRDNASCGCAVVLSSPGPITMSLAIRVKLVILGDPYGEGSDRQGTDHRTLFGQNQAHSRPDEARPFDQN